MSDGGPPGNDFIVEALERYYHCHGDSLKVEFPTGPGTMMTLAEVERKGP